MHMDGGPETSTHNLVPNHVDTTSFGLESCPVYGPVQLVTAIPVGHRVATTPLNRTAQKKSSEAQCQIVHDSTHMRRGWTESYLIINGRQTVGFGSVAVAGPWTDRPTIFEFYLLPDARGRAFDAFAVFLAASGAKFFEVQTSDTLLTVILHSYGTDFVSEKIGQ